MPPSRLPKIVRWVLWHAGHDGCSLVTTISRVKVGSSSQLVRKVCMPGPYIESKDTAVQGGQLKKYATSFNNSSESWQLPYLNPISKLENDLKQVFCHGLYPPLSILALEDVFPLHSTVWKNIFFFPFAFHHINWVKLAQEFRGKEDTPYPGHSLFPTQLGHPPALSICQAKLHIIETNGKGKDFAWETVNFQSKYHIHICQEQEVEFTAMCSWI